MVFMYARAELLYLWLSPVLFYTYPGTFAVNTASVRTFTSPAYNCTHVDITVNTGGQVTVTQVEIIEG